MFSRLIPSPFIFSPPSSTTFSPALFCYISASSSHYCSIFFFFISNLLLETHQILTSILLWFPPILLTPCTHPFPTYSPPVFHQIPHSPYPIRPHQDLDKTQDEVLKHQASISQLKRSFMEAPPPSPPQPNQWEKRLTSSPATIRVQQQQVVRPSGCLSLSTSHYIRWWLLGCCVSWTETNCISKTVCFYVQVGPPLCLMVEHYLFSIFVESLLT